MNKCRRQVTETAELLVVAGYAVLVPDLFGTGDSAGEFRAATWTTWRDNVVSAISWSMEQGLPVTGIVAIRLGCILAAEALEHASYTVRRTVFWQPVESGRQFMTQFLRLRVAASMMQSDRKETVDDLKRRLERGDAVDVAGYCLSSELWQAVEERQLSPLLSSRLGQLSVFDIGREPGEVSIATKRLLEKAIAREVNASADRIEGEPFWSATEIVTNRELTRRTVDDLAAVVR